VLADVPSNSPVGKLKKASKQSRTERDGPVAYVNLRCIEGLDLEAVPVMEFDGRSL
jgi:hypothetical protein